MEVKLSSHADVGDVDDVVDPSLFSFFFLMAGDFMVLFYYGFGSHAKTQCFWFGEPVKPHGVDYLGNGLLVKILVILYQRKVKGLFSKSLFILMMGSGLLCSYLLTPRSLGDEGYFVCLFPGSKVLSVVLHFLYLGVTLVFPIEVVLSSMDGEMDVVGGDLSPIEVELGATSYA